MAGEFLNYPGITSAVGLQAVRTHGVFPNQMMLWCLPQAGNIPASGTLTFGSTADTISMQAYVDRPTYRYSVVGHRVGLVLHDRRLFWKWGTVTGRYNVPLADGQLLNEKNPQELAAILWTAMGESGAPVSALPTAGRPEIHWDADRADLQLQELCELYGCEPTLKLDDTPDIVKMSVGAAVPTTGPIQSLAVSVDPPQVPAAIRLICGETKLQFRMLFEAVALEPDGKLVKIDDASYKPTGGFQADSDWGQFPTVDSEEGRYLAALSVGRWFRVKAFADDSLAVPVLGITLDSIDRILPLEPDLLDVTITSGIARQARPDVIAKYFVDGSPGVSENTEDPERIGTPFSLIPELGLIKFSEPILELKDDGTWDASKVYATVSFSIERSDTLIDIRQEYTLPMPGPFGEEAIREKTLFRTIIGRYDATTDTAPTITEDNEGDVSAAANAILAAAAAKYTTSQSGIVRWAGLFPFEPTGVIRQVGWLIQTGENGGFFTTVSVNAESLPYAPRLADRRQWRVTKGAPGQGDTAGLGRRLRRRGIRA